MDNKIYHGWIFTEKEAGYKDSISTHDREDRTISWGRGERAAAKAVEHFEITLGLGPVKLLSTPLGLRVYTEKEEEVKSKPIKRRPIDTHEEEEEE